MTNNPKDLCISHSGTLLNQHRDLPSAGIPLKVARVFMSAGMHCRSVMVQFSLSEQELTFGCSRTTVLSRPETKTTLPNINFAIPNNYFSYAFHVT